MFENAFIPFLINREKQLSGLKDPIDECMIYYLSKVHQVDFILFVYLFIAFKLYVTYILLLFKGLKYYRLC